jgi:hypothetical protein
MLTNDASLFLVSAFHSLPTSFRLHTHSHFILKYTGFSSFQLFSLDTFILDYFLVILFIIISHTYIYFALLLIH